MKRLGTHVRTSSTAAALDGDQPGKWDMEASGAWLASGPEIGEVALPY